MKRLTLLLPLVIVLGAAPAHAAPIGAVKYRIDASSYFDRYARACGWIKAHLALYKGYPSFANRVVKCGVPVIGYHDGATDGYAPLTPSRIASYVAKVKADASHGYAGTFMDDVNWTPGFRDGTQLQDSVEPEAGKLASLIEAVRRAIGPRGIIEMNSQLDDLWPLMKAHNANVNRALAKINLVTKEFGVAQIGSASSYRELFEYAAALHAKGVHLVMCGTYQNKTVPMMEWNQATYFLLNDGGDYVNGSHQYPRSFWAGFDVNLGEATSPRARSRLGLWSRHFTKGVVYSLEPGAATRTIRLPKAMHSAEWGTVTSVTLAAKQGAVLVG